MHVRDYERFGAAYVVLNARLFGGRLPAGEGVTFTLVRRHNTHGYFSPERYATRTQKTAIHEIALNPDSSWRTDIDVLSTLVHEMTHLEQHLFGNPSRRGYHNREWAELMLRVGLIPTDTGAPDGKKTGQHMTHYVEPGGPFEEAAEALIANGWTFDLAHRIEDGTGRKPIDPSKVCFSCPSCGQNAWAKAGAALFCGAEGCDAEPMLPKSSRSLSLQFRTIIERMTRRSDCRDHP